MKKKLIIIILFIILSVNISAQMVTSNPILEALMGTVANMEIEKVNLATKEYTEKELEDEMARIEHLHNLKETIYSLQKVGKIAHSGGQNLKDLMDTTNDISNLMRQSIVFNKGIDELTDLDQIKALDEIREIREEAKKTTSDLDTLIKNTKKRLGNKEEAISEIMDMINHFNPNFNPQIKKLDEISTTMEDINKTMENMSVFMQGQAIQLKVESKLKDKEDAIKNKQELKKKAIQKKIDDKYYESFKNLIPSNQKVIDDLGLNVKIKNKKDKKGGRIKWKSLNGQELNLKKK